VDTARRRHLPLLGLILLVGAVLRFSSLGERPPGGYWDEKAICVNARLVADSGRDQYGARLPLFWRALDDYKAPAFPYAFVVWSRVFGDDVASARALAGAFGLLSLVGTWLLAREVLGPGPGPVLATAMLAVSPWHLQYSRIAWQAITLVALHAFAAGALLRGLRLGPQRGAPWLGGGAVLLAATLYTYSPARLWVPLLALAVVAAALRGGRWPWDASLSARLALVFGLTALPFALSFAAQHGSLTLRFAQLNVLDGPTPVRSAVSSYLAHFDPGFLFGQGDPNLRHSPPGSGQLLWAQAVLLPVGVYSLLRRRQPGDVLVLLWLVLAPLLGALTPGPHATRTIALLPALQVVGAAGALALLRWAGPRREVARLALALTLALSAGVSVRAVFRAPDDAVAAAWQGDVPATIETARALQAEHGLSDVTFLRATRVTYIDWLYATRPDPAAIAARADTLRTGRDRYDPFDEAGKFAFAGARFPAPDQPVALGPDTLLVAPAGVTPPGLTLLRTQGSVAFWGAE
jgi:hypothetical protein